MNGISATKYCHSNHNRLRALFSRFFFLHAQHRGSRSTKTEKTKKKQAEAENNEFKTKTELYPVVFAHLASEINSTQTKNGAAKSGTPSPTSSRE